MAVRQMKVWHAWYSHQAVLDGHGSSIYRRMDGTVVEVTNVTMGDRAKGEAFYLWPDKVYLGEVVEYVGPGAGGDYRFTWEAGKEVEMPAKLPSNEGAWDLARLNKDADNTVRYGAWVVRWSGWMWGRFGHLEILSYWLAFRPGNSWSIVSPYPGPVQRVPDGGEIDTEPQANQGVNLLLVAPERLEVVAAAAKEVSRRKLFEAIDEEERNPPDTHQKHLGVMGTWMGMDRSAEPVLRANPWAKSGQTRNFDEEMLRRALFGPRQTGAARDEVAGIFVPHPDDVIPAARKIHGGPCPTCGAPWHLGDECPMGPPPMVVTHTCGSCGAGFDAAEQLVKHWSDRHGLPSTHSGQHVTADDIERAMEPPEIEGYSDTEHTVSAAEGIKLLQEEAERKAWPKGEDLQCARCQTPLRSKAWTDPETSKRYEADTTCWSCDCTEVVPRVRR